MTYLCFYLKTDLVKETELIGNDLSDGVFGKSKSDYKVMIIQLSSSR